MPGNDVLSAGDHNKMKMVTEQPFKQVKQPRKWERGLGGGRDCSG